MLTCNCTSLTSARQWLEGKDFQVVCLQEIKRDQGMVGEVAMWAKRQGWRAHVTPSVRTEAEGLSAGAMVLVKDYIGSRTVKPEVLLPYIQDGRVAVCLANKCKGHNLVVVSIYCMASVGMNDYNVKLLDAVGQYIWSLRHGSWVIAGDWNVGPEALLRTEVPQRLRASVVAAEGGAITCTQGGGTCLDFFLLGPLVRGALRGASRRLDSPIATHYPVELGLVGLKGRGHRLVLQRPKELPASLPEWSACAAARRVALDFEELARRLRDAEVSLEEGFQLWSELGEKHALALATGSEEVPREYRGRGVAPVRVSRPSRPKLEEETEGRGQDLSHAKLGAIRRRLEEVVSLKRGASARAEAAAAGILRRVARSAGAWLPQAYKAAWLERLAGAEGASLGLLEQWAEELRAEHSRLQKENEARGRQAWQDFCMHTLGRSWGPLARWVRACPMLSPQSATVDGEITFQPDAVAEEALRQWSGLWLPEGGPSRQDALEALEAVRAAPLLPVAPGRLRAAARKRAGAGRGTDHWGPTEMADLPREAFEALSLLLHEVEVQGAFPPSLRYSVTHLLDKEAGEEALQLRPIGVLPKLYRLWAGVRQKEVREWRAAQELGWAWGHGAGRSSLDAAWSSLLNAEIARHTGGLFVAAYFDLSKAYERMAIRVVLDMAQEMGFPLAVAKVSCAQYLGKRAVLIEGTCSSWFPGGSCGVIAGCANAVALLVCFLARRIESLHAIHPQLVVRNIVDDVALELLLWDEDPAEPVAKGAQEWAVQVRAMGGTLNEVKTGIVASNAKLRRKVRERLPGWRLMDTPAVRDLGIDTAAAARRSTKVRAKRLAKAGPRRRRAARVKADRRRKANLARCMVYAVQAYGQEAAPIAESTLRKMRQSHLAAVAGRMYRRCCLAGVALLGRGRRCFDPLVGARVAAVRKWALACWRGRLPGHPLEEAWEALAQKAGSRGLSGQWLRGPLSGTLDAVVRVGWAPAGPLAWTDHVGLCVDVAEVAPAEVCARVEEACWRAEWLACAKRRPRDTGGLRSAADMSEARAFRDRLSPERRGAFERVLLGAMWTQARRASVGMEESSCCPWCSQEEEDEVHRFFACPVLAEPGALACYQRLPAELKIDAFLRRGLLPQHLTCIEEARRPTFAKEEPEGWRAAQPFYSGVIYSDGGARRPKDTGTRVVAWATVLPGAGCRAGAILGGWRPTVVRAELMGVLVGLQASVAPVLVVVDNERAHDWCQELKEGFKHEESPCADLLRAIAKEIARVGPAGTSFRWIPSHVLEMETFGPQRRAAIEAKLAKARRMGPVDEEWFVGNQMADRLADEVLERGDIAAELVHRVEFIRECAREVWSCQVEAALRAAQGAQRSEAEEDRAARALARRAAARSRAGERNTDPARFDGPSAGGHVISYTGVMWKCMRCERVARSMRSLRHLRSDMCAGQPYAVRCKAEMGLRRSFKLAAFQASMVEKYGGQAHQVEVCQEVLICRKCGCISKRGMKEFDRRCRGKVTAEGRRNLSAVSAGVTPTRKVVLQGQSSLDRFWG